MHSGHHDRVSCELHLYLCRHGFVLIHSQGILQWTGAVPTSATFAVPRPRSRQLLLAPQTTKDSCQESVDVSILLMCRVQGSFRGNPSVRLHGRLFASLLAPVCGHGRVYYLSAFVHGSFLRCSHVLLLVCS